jgi:site-specific recombinase XerC
MPRPRKHKPSIPGHIDQGRLPRGIYWDATGAGRWYVLIREDGRQRAKTVAGRDALLSDLHRIVEHRADPARGTLQALFAAFERSPAWTALSPATKRDYGVSRRLVAEHPTRLGTPFGQLAIARISQPVIQRLIDKIAETRPTTAAHALQYLRRVLRWGINRGHCTHNPAQGVEAPSLTPRRRLPTHEAHLALLRYAAERGLRPAHTGGSVAPYLWICMELAYLCHLRGIELLDLRESQGTADYLLASRRKGSRATQFRWSPRLRAAWEAALKQRDSAWARKRRAVPLRPEDRPVIVGQGGGALTRSSLDTAWQRLIKSAITDGIISADQRFGLHDLKRKGITDRPGTRADKQMASGHRTAAMMDVYDLSTPLVDPATTG